MAYLGIAPFEQTVRTVSTFTATASQTTFSPTGGYVLGYVDVYLNGIKLVAGDDFTATNALTVVLTLGASEGDVLETVAYFPTSLVGTTNINGGTINDTTIGATTASTGAFTTLSTSGAATFSAGTASAPAITTTGDTNTGIFFPAADTIAFTEGGVEAMRITSTGLITGNGRNISPAMVPVGSVIQTQWNNMTVGFTATSASYVQVTAFNQTFTPLYASSKVYITFNTGINLICDGSVALTRNGSIIKDTWFGSSRQDDQFDYPQASGFYLDSPGTTSTVTYGIQVRATGCGNVIRIGGSDNHQSWTFMEIAG